MSSSTVRGSRSSDRKGIIRRIYPGIRSQSQPNPEASFEETMQQIRAKVRDLCCEN